jgi:hypothetical protein
MKRFWLIVLLLPSVVFLAQSQQTKLATRQGFTVSLPVSVDPETVKIHSGVYGRSDPVFSVFGTRRSGSSGSY